MKDEAECKHCGELIEYWSAQDHENLCQSCYEFFHQDELRRF